MKRYYLAAIALLVLFVIVGSTQYAWATDVNVTQSDSCAAINVHIVSVWDGTTRVYIDDGASLIHVDVAPRATRDVAVQWNTRTEVHVVVSAPTAHLHGAVDVTHTLPASCTTPTTTEAPPSTTSPTTAPTAPSTSAPAPSASSTPVATTVPGPSTSSTAPPPSRPPSSTPVSLTLPTTGSAPTFRALLGFGFGIVGLALVAATRRRAS